MSSYFHSVTLDKDKCKGCTNCIKRCPTEAIRVRNGKAKIIKERCIDCGVCLKVCPYHAKQAVTDHYDMIFDYDYKIALPAPTLYGQFWEINDINVILTGLKLLGFDEIYEIANSAATISRLSRELIAKGTLKKPVISSACPAVVRLIRVRFPNLIENIMPIYSPMDLAAGQARKRASRQMGIPKDRIGIFFISPCAAKVTSCKAPLGLEHSDVDGIISIAEIYKNMAPFINKIEKVEKLCTCSAEGISWARSGGESYALQSEKCIAVDGIHNVIKVLEEVEDDKLSDIDFVEALSCTGGCVGGPLTIENTFVAKAKIRQLSKNYGAPESELDVKLNDIILGKKIQYVPILNLDNDMNKAIKIMEEIDKIDSDMPGLDCGSCGAPSCRAMAEDIVKGYATMDDCIFKLKEKLQSGQK